jgi:hypothetical protein
VNSESVAYAAGDICCRGEPIYDDGAKELPLLRVAPNWRKCGLPAGTIELMLRDNPARMLTFAPRAN